MTWTPDTFTESQILKASHLTNINAGIKEAIAGYAPSLSKVSDFTLALSDIGFALDCTKPSGTQKCTVPLQSAVAIPDGAVFPIAMLGGATLELLVASGTVKLAPAVSGHTIKGAGEGFVLRKSGGGDQWVVVGLE